MEYLSRGAEMAHKTDWNKNLPLKCLQFGADDQKRAGIDELLDRAGLGIAVICDKNTAVKMRAQDGLYTAVMRDADMEEVRVIKAIEEYMTPDSQDLSDIVLSPELSYVILDEDDLPAAHALLQARFSLALPPVTFLVDRMTAPAPDWLCENGCSLVRMLSDRIVAGYPRTEALSLGKKLQYEDELMVASEKYIKLYAQTDDETAKKLRKDGLPLEQVEDVRPYIVMHDAMLTGCMLGMSCAGWLLGLNTISDCMRDDDIRPFFGHLLMDEIMPEMPLPEEQVTAYAVALSARLCNQKNHVMLCDINDYGIQKFTACLLPVLTAHTGKNDEIPQCLLFVMASLLMYYAGARRLESGKYKGLRGDEEFIIREDDDTMDVMCRLSCDMPADSLSYAFLADRTLWAGLDLREIDGLEDALTEVIQDIQILGLNTAMDNTHARE